MTGSGDRQSERAGAAQQTAAPAVPTEPVQLPARRVLLRGAVAAVPTILTLHSGEALARSSNLISVTHESPPKGEKYLCLDKSSVSRAGQSRYDLGEPPQADVTAIPQRTYYRLRDTDYRVSPEEMCDHGGEFYYRTTDDRSHHDDTPGTDKGWRKVSLRRGGLVSATALGSFAKHPGVRVNTLKDI